MEKELAELKHEWKLREIKARYEEIGRCVKLAIVVGSAVTCVIASFVLFPKWNVYRSRLTGEAEFARAEQNRRIRIEEAKANLEAERMNAEAEVERAKGAAKAIEIENGKITPTYIRYLWVRQQNLAGSKVIYIPTEGGLPILEAGREIK